MKNVVEFKEINGDEYPSVCSLISTVEDTYKNEIVDYLRKGKHIAESPARLTDYITGQPIGIHLSMQSDGQYFWRSDIVYYYEKYNIKLNDDFVAHVLNSGCQVYIEDLEEFDGTYVDVNAPIPDVLYDYTAMAQYMRVNGKEYSQITEEEIESFRIN